MTRKTIFKQFNERDLNYFYYDKTFNSKGMDYNKYIKLKFNSVNDKLIKNVYTIDGWYLMWVIMCRADNQQYIKTTISCLADDCNMSIKKIKETLIYLQKEKIIEINLIKNITCNTIIEIYIDYNNYKSDDIGYKAIPIDYVRPILQNINSSQWAILSVLLTKYNYYTISENIDKETGEISLNYKRNHYAFPTMKQMEEYIGISSSNIQRGIQKIIKSKYNIINIDTYSNGKTYYNEDLDKFIYKNPNIIYYIPLFEQAEYAYHHIYNITNSKEKNRNGKLLKDLKNKNFKDVVVDYYGKDEIFLKDYIKAYYEINMLEYKKSLDLKDKEIYESVRESKIIVM